MAFSEQMDEFLILIALLPLLKRYNFNKFSDCADNKKEDNKNRKPHREFIYTKQPYISACHLEGIEDNVILIDSVSKRYSECGIRIGALITKNKEVRLAYVLNKEDLSKAIFVLQKALEEYNRQNGQA